MPSARASQEGSTPTALAGPAERSRALTVLGVLWLCAVGAFGVSLAGFTAHAVDRDRHERYSRALRALPAADATLNNEVLRARLGLVTQYDGMVHTEARLEALHQRLADVPRDLSPAGRRAVAAAVRDSLTVLRDKAARIERFKTEYAILRNSSRYFPIAAEESLARDAETPDTAVPETTLRAFTLTVLRYTLLGDAALRDQAMASLDQVRQQRPTGTVTPAVQSLDVVLSHARAILDHKPRVDDLVDGIVSLPSAARAQAVDVAYTRHHDAAVAAEVSRRGVLFLEGLVIVALGAAVVILRLARAARDQAQAAEGLAAANKVLTAEHARERELSELKSRFVSMTSHEFRTPLSIILSSAELLEAYGDKWKPERRRDHLGRVRAAVDGMIRLLDDVLVLGRADAGHMSCEPEATDLAAFCTELSDDMALQSGGRHTVAFRPLSLPDRVTVDPRLLRHVLTNLLSNAIKYSPAGGTVTLDVTVPAGGATVVFTVRDTGIGIPPEDLARLYESFHRARNVGAIQGTGLGLAIVKRSVDAHGGTIAVESAVGRGTAFTVTLPLPPAGTAS